MKKVIGSIAGFAALAVPVAASAVPPTLISPGQVDRRSTATFSAPSADFVTVTVAAKPGVATNGEFFTENIERFAILTDQEIQSGSWRDTTRLNPGRYWMQIKASPSLDACFILEAGLANPTCADGLSNIVAFTVPKPVSRYTSTARVFRFLGEVDLGLTASRVGERRAYRVCWVNRSRTTKCRAGVLRGHSWESPASDTLEVRTGNLPAVTRFTWRVGNRVVARRAVRIR